MAVESYTKNRDKRTAQQQRIALAMIRGGVGGVRKVSKADIRTLPIRARKENERLLSMRALG